MDSDQFEFKNWLRRTPKLLLASYILLVIGFFGGITARRGFFWFLFFVGITLLFIWLFIWIIRRIALPIIAKENVVDQWDILIGGGQGRGDTIFDNTQKLISATKAPDINMEKKDVAPGAVRGFLGGKKPFLIISSNTGYHLKLYQMYINARDYGNNLQVSWYLVYQLSFWGKAAAILLLVPFINLFVLPFYLFIRLIRARSSGLLDLDLFDEQDLRAYVTNAHHCLLEVVEKLIVDLHQDPSKIERKSRGFLGIS